MSWSMPTTSQWNPGIAQLTPDMGLGSYTPEQWAAMQQQNWQQWAQWQQQYAQWQSQYGEKYAEQMQAMQAMGSMPPLPPTNSAPPPAPPPPEKPPPPPHENNQPLYGHTQSQPAPVPAPVHNQNQMVNSSSYNNIQNITGSNQNWSYAIETRVETTSASVNTEALKKLAEEERLFDIQFQKWEEEIEKWKRENVNHPDKQAYSEYEQKFEACRAQLLERRQQMKQKRARLLNISPQAASIGQGIASTAVPPPPPNTNKNYSTNVPSHNINNKPTQVNYQHQDNSQHQKYVNIPQTGFNRNNKNIDPQDRYESYQEINDKKYSNNSNNFLPTTDSTKGIPGLDLVPDVDKIVTANKQDVIDITDDQTDSMQQPKPEAPDYSTISKGINNILGDEKIMNILSMVRGQSSSFGNMVNQNISNQSLSYSADSNNHKISSNQWDRNENTYNQQYVNTVNKQNLLFKRQDLNQHQIQELNPKFASTQNRVYDERQVDTSQDQYYDRNAQESQNIVSRSGPPPLRSNMSLSSPPFQDMSGQQNRNDYLKGPHDNRILDNRSHDNRSHDNRSHDNRSHDNRSHDNRSHNSDVNTSLNQPVRPKWVDEPMFTPSIIVEYEHKPLRLKARDFIEPVHMFDYNHKSKDEDYKKKDFEKEVDDLFIRKSRRPDVDDSRSGSERFSRDHTRDYERRMPREELRNDYRPRGPIRDDYEDRRRIDDRYEDRRQDDRDKYNRREDFYRDRERERDRDRERDLYRDKHRDYRRDDKNRSRSHDRESRKRGRSKDTELSDNSMSKKSKESDSSVTNFQTNESPKHVVMIDDILERPGRDMRPEKIVIILRGPPGSGKSYLAKLIRDREAEYNGTVRIMSIDDYFMQEGEIEEKDPATGKITKKPLLKYEYEEKSEEIYLNSLKRAFKRTLTDGYFTFLIYDAVNDQLKSYADIWNFARQNSFQVYICTMELDPQVCFKRNIHNRTLEDIEAICSRFFTTPAHHIQLDPTTLLQSAAIPDVQMEDVNDEVIMEDTQENEVESVFTSKWEKMDDAAQLARLDGTSKPLRSSQLSMEDYLQLDDWKPNTAKPGKKTVRWADIEERRQQEKMRAIGFVVGQTDWNRMTDPTMGSSALTQTKYIERVRRT